MPMACPINGPLQNPANAALPMRPPFVVGSASSFVAVRNSRLCLGCTASGRGRRHALAQHPAEPLHTQFALVVAVGVWAE